MRDFLFTNDLSRRNIGGAATLLEQPRLWIPGGDYPEHALWSEKALAQIEAENKRAMLAWWGSDPVGIVVYQRHKADPTKLEIKNISVEAAARGRHIAGFLLRQAELEGPVDYPGCVMAVADAKVTNKVILAFARQQGYTIEGVAPVDAQLAHNGVPDVIFSKPLGPYDAYPDLL